MNRRSCSVKDPRDIFWTGCCLSCAGGVQSGDDNPVPRFCAWCTECGLIWRKEDLSLYDLEMLTKPYTPQKKIVTRNQEHGRRVNLDE